MFGEQSGHLGWTLKGSHSPLSCPPRLLRHSPTPTPLLQAVQFQIAFSFNDFTRMMPRVCQSMSLFQILILKSASSSRFRKFTLVAGNGGGQHANDDENEGWGWRGCGNVGWTDGLVSVSRSRAGLGCHETWSLGFRSLPRPTHTTCRDLFQQETFQQSGIEHWSLDFCNLKFWFLSALIQ